MTLPLPDQNVRPRRNDDLAQRVENLYKAMDSVQRNLDELARQFPLQPENIAGAGDLAAVGPLVGYRGVDQATFPGGTDNVDLVIAHGLSDTPACVVASPASRDAGLQKVTVDLGSVGTSTFTVRVSMVTGFQPSGGTQLPVNWIALL